MDYKSHYVRAEQRFPLFQGFSALRYMRSGLFHLCKFLPDLSPPPHTRKRTEEELAEIEDDEKLDRIAAIFEENYYNDDEEDEEE